jgi:hypothetical protein
VPAELLVIMPIPILIEQGHDVTVFELKTKKNVIQLKKYMDSFDRLW